MAFIMLNPSEFGWINYNVATEVYTAYDAPIGAGTCYCVETNSPTNVKRTYYKFNSSAGKTYESKPGTLTIYISAVTYAILGPGETINFRLNVKGSRYDFIGDSISIPPDDDWGGGQIDNIKSWAASVPSGSQNITIGAPSVNIEFDTCFEIIEDCYYGGGYSGTVQFELDAKVARTGFWRVQFVASYFDAKGAVISDAVIEDSTIT